MLRISIKILQPGIDAVASQRKAQYVQMTMSRSSDIASLRAVGWLVAQPSWRAFMVKPLLPDLTAEDARRLFGIGTDRFLISGLDTA
jgi:hypothetical protein